MFFVSKNHSINGTNEIGKPYCTMCTDVSVTKIKQKNW